MLDKIVPLKIKYFFELIRLSKPTGFILLMWPCWFALTLVPLNSTNLIKWYVFFFIGAFLMRSAGCIINDLVDINIDKNISRTNNRPLASNKLSKAEAISFLFLLLILSFFILLQFNIYSILVEPNNISADFSKKNISNKNYTILNYAISSEQKIVQFDDTLEDNRSSNINPSSEKKIHTKTIDDILDNYNDFEPFIVKIDIEGYEKDLFKNNYDWINKFDVLIIEIHDWMIPSKSISFNFFNAITESMKNNFKRDIIISGENLILVKNNDN